MMEAYIRNWKRGVAILFIVSFVFSIAGFIGYSVSAFIAWIFNVKLSSDWITLGLVTLSPAYLGISHGALKGFFNEIK